MALRMGHLYDALLEAHVPHELAAQAADEVAARAFGRGDLWRDVSIIKWMVAINMALVIVTLVVLSRFINWD